MSSWFSRIQRQLEQDPLATGTSIFVGLLTLVLLQRIIKRFVGGRRSSGQKAKKQLPPEFSNAQRLPGSYTILAERKHTVPVPSRGWVPEALSGMGPRFRFTRSFLCQKSAASLCGALDTKRRPNDPTQIPFDTFVMIRHGERQDHAHPSWKDTTNVPDDPPLSIQGKAQAEELAKWWLQHQKRSRGGGQKFDVTCVVTSPLIRCVETAQTLAATLNVPMLLHEGLTDLLSPKIYKKAPTFQFHEAKRQRSGPSEPFFNYSERSPSYPESASKFNERVLSALDDVVASLLCRLPTSTPSEDQLSFKSADLGTRNEEIEVALRRQSADERLRLLPSIRVLVVTHTDVVRAATEALCPKDVMTVCGASPSVPYCSMSELRRARFCSSNEPQSLWQLVKFGSREGVMQHGTKTKFV